MRKWVAKQDKVEFNQIKVEQPRKCFDNKRTHRRCVDRSAYVWMCAPWLCCYSVLMYRFWRMMIERKRGKWREADSESESETMNGKRDSWTIGMYLGDMKTMEHKNVNDWIVMLGMSCADVLHYSLQDDAIHYWNWMEMYAYVHTYLTSICFVCENVFISISLQKCSNVLMYCAESAKRNKEEKKKLTQCEYDVFVCMYFYTRTRIFFIFFFFCFEIVTFVHIFYSERVLPYILTRNVIVKAMPRSVSTSNKVPRSYDLTLYCILYWGLNYTKERNETKRNEKRKKKHCL